MITLWNSVLFLWNGSTYSTPDAIVNYTLHGSSDQEDNGMNGSGRSLLFDVGIDLLLIILFMMQHSGMASMKVKSVLLGTQFEDLYRSIYVFATASVLQIILYTWNGIPEVCLWNINLINNTLLRWIFFLGHFLAWTVVYGGSLMMDLPEMVGLKQVYYHGCAFESPLHLKSRELQTFYQHMRHPSFTALCFIFWFQPCMTLDRLLLATTLTLYMIFRFAVDINDYQYQKRQFEIKFEKHQMIKYS